MTEPAEVQNPSSAPVVLRIILAVICLLPAVIGLLIIAPIFIAFVYEGFRFKPSDEVWMQLFIGLAAVLVLLPAIVIGIILRYARWKRAASASLVLAIIVGGTGALSSGMLQTTVVSGDTESYTLLMFFSIAGIVAGAVPPFFHWWNSREQA
jgi:hypothetical protein